MTTRAAYALVVAAGSGVRLGGTLPKQYQPIAGVPMLRHSVAALLAHPGISGVQVVMGAGQEALYAHAFPQGYPKLLPPVTGGAARPDSVAAGLLALSPHAPDDVLIHDAARPFLTRAMIDQILAALTPECAVVPALPVVDTVRRYTDGEWADVDRAGLMRIQTPQAFPFAALRALSPSPTATDDAALWLAAGKKLVSVPGMESLRKVTTMDDLIWAEQHAARTRMAVGMGFDVHAFVASPNGFVTLGGVQIPHTHRLDGHSDADVVLHAVVDALLGAVAAGDIGSHFPPSDPQWRGADSRMFIAEALRLVTLHGGVIEHLDVTIIGERPKITPHRDAMRAAIAAMLNLALAQVSVKATTTEKLGFTGREEGLAAQAVATVRVSC